MVIVMVIVMVDPSGVSWTRRVLHTVLEALEVLEVVEVSQECTHPYPYPCAAHIVPRVPQTPSTAHSYALMYCSVDIQRSSSFRYRNHPSLGCGASVRVGA